MSDTPREDAGTIAEIVKNLRELADWARLGADELEAATDTGWRDVVIRDQRQIIEDQTVEIAALKARIKDVEP